ncbi:MAG: potassium transporter Kup [Bradymonadaceae bacterium]
MAGSSMSTSSADAGESGHGHEESLGTLALAAIGIVYGDIGTSPLYAIRESINEYAGIQATATSVLGILSLIFWSLILVISFKYIGLVMQADNDGEGGIIALTALISSPREEPERWSSRWIFLLLGLFGAALLWGDSMITPAISVVSAIEGLKVATPIFDPYVIPITIGILIGLFLFQSRGTAGVGKVFGPITLVWFLLLGTLGVLNLVDNPAVFRALSPTYAVEFFAQNGWQGFLVLGSVFLVVTGGEALYADIGHFGTFPIRLTWFGLVLPCLLLNYFGQGALILNNLGNHELIEQPFFHMLPESLPHWMLYVQVAMATAATIIASQAVISGAFSLTRQAVQMGYLPRLHVDHTSEEKEGQIYMPAVNWTLMIACIGLVIGFSLPAGKTSSNLAAAYGVAVTTDFVFTTLLFLVVARVLWGWNLVILSLLGLGLFIIDFGFWGAMITKIPEGGWFPLVVAGLFFLVMTTWKRGRNILAERLEETIRPLDEFFADVEDREPERVPGTAVYMSSNTSGTPHAMEHNFEHNHVLHERTVILTIQTADHPYVSPEERVEIVDEGKNVYRLIAHFGFAEDPHIPRLLSGREVGGEGFTLDETTFFLGRETLLATERPGMAIWREKLFARMSRNARKASRYFQLPSDRVVEVGTQIEL